HLRETENRVERRAQLVDQLAQRIGRELGAEHAGRRILQRAPRDLVRAGPARRPAIALEGARRRVEKRKAGNPPVARRRPLPGDGEAGVTERAALLEATGSLAVDAMLAATGDPGDALPDQGP